MGLFGAEEESDNDSVSAKQIENFHNTMAAKILQNTSSNANVASPKDINLDEIKEIISKKMDKK